MLTGIRARLTQDLADLEKQLEELREEASSESEDSGLNEDFADAGTSTFDRERDLSIRYNVEDLIDQVRRALARIDEGKYGVCENCGNPIDAARLKAFPRMLMCLDCKRRDERAR
jgi:DnaK suppressor protein